MQISRLDKRSDSPFNVLSSVYLGLSCVYTYGVSVTAEAFAFANADELRNHGMSSALVKVTRYSSWYIGSQIAIPEFHLTLGRMEPGYTLRFFIVIALTSVLIGSLTLLFETKNRPRKLIIPIAIFVLSTVGYSAFMHPAAAGTVLVAVCYSFLFFVGRGVRAFNPHWELYDRNLLDEEKFKAIWQLFNHYVLTAIAAIAFIIAACFFNASTLIKDALWTQGISDTNKLYRVVQRPFLLTTIAYGIFGCFWLSILIIRELHVKQHELLLMPIRASVPALAARQGQQGVE